MRVKTHYLRVIALSVVTCILWLSAARAVDFWKPASVVDLAQAQEKISNAAKIDRTLLRQPMILAYKTALYLATGSMDTATRGGEQKVSAKFGQGEEPYSTAVVTVEFMGYADDSLTGERFTLYLEVGKDGFWRVIKAERAAYGRGDHR
jgi:hypothetical protein